uniref:Peptidase S1 domain-containing protein n=1 Tax=Musca domestica TaxID=7370 RepID=A0A1I8MPF8_MUSDO
MVLYLIFVEETGYDPSDFTVHAGSNDRFQGGVLVNVAEIIAHEDYGNFLNDVALLRLAEPLIYSKNIQPIPLATTEVPAGAPVIISGFGRLQHGGDMPEKLQWNTLTALSGSECEEMFHLDTDDVMCLDHEANNGLCHGDFGGPAIYNGEMVGIGSFLFGYCGNSYPDGYAKVFYHSEWIRKHSDL